MVSVDTPVSSVLFLPQALLDKGVHGQRNLLYFQALLGLLPSFRRFVVRLEKQVGRGVLERVGFFVASQERVVDALVHLQSRVVVRTLAHVLSALPPLLLHLVNNNANVLVFFRPLLRRQGLFEQSLRVAWRPLQSGALLRHVAEVVVLNENLVIVEGFEGLQVWLLVARVVALRVHFGKGVVDFGGLRQREYLLLHQLQERALTGLFARRGQLT